MSDWLSPTKIITYLQCPREYYVKYVLGIFESSTALRGGSAVHEAAEKLAKWGKADCPTGMWATKLYEQAEVIFREAWDGNTEGEDDVEIERYAAMFRVYVDTIYKRIKSTLASGKALNLAWQWAWPEQVEQWLKDPDLKIRGIADEITANVSIHNNYGQKWIVDLKTNKMSTIPFKSDHQFQVMLYAILYFKQKREFPAGLALWYLDGNIWTIYEVTPEAIENVQFGVAQARDGIEREDWTPRKHKFCDWCPGKGDCPEFNS